MLGEIVSWSDYEGLANGDLAGEDEVLFGGGAGPRAAGELNKALMAGDDIANPGAAAGEGFPLRLEALDQTLFNVTYRASDIAFWRSLYKDAATNTVVEFNRLESYGSGNAVWMGEGDLPAEDDSTYSRQYTKIRYMGCVRRISLVTSLLKTAHGDAVAREATNGTLWLLRQLEQTLFGGNEDMVSVQIDGLEKILTTAWGTTVLDDAYVSGYEDTDHVVDMRGAALTEDHITDLVEKLIKAPNHGRPNNLWLPTGPVKDLSKIMYPKERYDVMAPGKDGMGGNRLKGITTPFGDIAFQPDIFIPTSDIPVAAGVGRAAMRPGTPIVTVAPTSPVYAGANTNYWTAAYAGTYFYKVCACSRYGKSVPVTTAAIAVTAGDNVVFTIQDVGPDTSYFEIYRSDMNGAASTCRKIMDVARTGAIQVITDMNRFLPNTSRGFMLTQNSDVLKWKQLAPFTRIPLATIDTTIRFMLLLMGGLQVQKPLQCGMFINIGNLATGAYA